MRVKTRMRSGARSLSWDGIAAGRRRRVVDLCVKKIRIKSQDLFCPPVSTSSARGFRRATDRAFVYLNILFGVDFAYLFRSRRSLAIGRKDLAIPTEPSAIRSQEEEEVCTDRNSCQLLKMMPEEIYDEEEAEDEDSPSEGESPAQDVPQQPQQQAEGGEDDANEIEGRSERAASSSLTGSTEKSNDAIDEADADENQCSNNASGVAGEDDGMDFVEVSPAASSSPASGPRQGETSKDIANTMRLPAGNKSGDLLESVAKRLLGHPDHRQQQQLETKTPQRGNDFLRQVKRDFADASGDIATSASALKASIQSSLQASPRGSTRKEVQERHADLSGDGETQKEHVESEPPGTNSTITSSTRFGAPALPSLATGSAIASKQTGSSAAKAPTSGTPAAKPVRIAAGTTPVPKPTTTSVIKPTLKVSQSTEHAHSFHEHTYKQPTYCGICNGLLVGLWSQGFKCELCDMNVHRGGGAGDHDDCRAEALLAPCPGPDHGAVEVKEKKTTEQAKLSDVVAQIRALAENPNFLKEISEQVDKDLRARAKEAIVEVAVDDERNKNLRRLKEGLVPFVAKMDAMVAKGEIYVFVVLMTILSLATIVQTIISLGLFLVALGPRHGFLSITSFQLAAMHDATVTAALHTVLAILSAVAFHLACLFKRKQNLINRFLLDAFRINAATDIGISVADAAQQLMSWSKRLLVSTLLSCMVSYFFWHQSQPLSWAAAKLPPTANILIPSFVFTLCAGAVSYFSYVNAPPDMALEGYVDVKLEMIQNEIDFAAARHGDPGLAEGAKKIAEPNLVEEEQTGQLGSEHNQNEKSNTVNDAELHDLLDELVPSGAIIE